MRPINPINIELGVPFITQKCASGILRTILQLLLYQRNQIPFWYAMFRSRVEKLEQIENTESDEVKAGSMCSSMQLKKQRARAKETFHNIETLFDTIDKILTTHGTVREVMILFGRTIYTAKEATIIHLPPINPHHNGQNHRQAMNKYLQHIAKTLSLSNESFDNSHVHNATNMFVLMKPSDPGLLGPSNACMFPLDEFQLPTKCVQFVVHMKTTELSDDFPDCGCQRFKIFEEASEPHNEYENQPEATNNDPGIKTSWHQVDVTVKGFQPALRNGCQIWE